MVHISQMESFHAHRVAYMTANPKATIFDWHVCSNRVIEPQLRREFKESVEASIREHAARLEKENAYNQPSSQPEQ